MKITIMKAFLKHCNKCKDNGELSFQHVYKEVMSKKGKNKTFELVFTREIIKEK